MQPVKTILGLAAVCAVTAASPAAAMAKPHPVGTAVTTVTYDTAGGPVSFSETFGFVETGAGLDDIRNIGQAPNVGGFIAVDALGRRSNVALIDPAVQGANETLMRHGFYKADPNNQMQRGDDFFPGINVDGDLTLSVTGITFDQPVQVQPNTFLLHMLWDIDQVDQLGVDDQGVPRTYVHPHIHHTVAPFRDVDSFFLGASPTFSDVPVSNYVLGDVTPVIQQTAPDTINIEVTFPYRLLTHLEDDGLGIPAGVDLPAPGGFLEPFHLHFEYLVIPEPASLLLLAGGAGLLFRRRPASD